MLAGHKISVSSKPREFVSSSSFSLFNSFLLPGQHYVFNFFKIAMCLLWRFPFNCLNTILCFIQSTRWQITVFIMIICKWNLDTDLDKAMGAMLFFLKNNDISVIFFYLLYWGWGFYFTRTDKILW